MSSKSGVKDSVLQRSSGLLRAVVSDFVVLLRKLAQAVFWASEACFDGSHSQVMRISFLLPLLWAPVLAS